MRDIVAPESASQDKALFLTEVMVKRVRYLYPEGADNDKLKKNNAILEKVVLYSKHFSTLGCAAVPRCQSTPS